MTNSFWAGGQDSRGNFILHLFFKGSIYFLNSVHFSCKTIPWKRISKVNNLGRQKKNLFSVFSRQMRCMRTLSRTETGSVLLRLYIYIYNQVFKRIYKCFWQPSFAGKENLDCTEQQWTPTPSKYQETWQRWGRTRKPYKACRPWDL